MTASVPLGVTDPATYALVFRKLNTPPAPSQVPWVPRPAVMNTLPVSGMSLFQSASPEKYDATDPMTLVVQVPFGSEVSRDTASDCHVHRPPPPRSDGPDVAGMPLAPDASAHQVKFRIARLAVVPDPVSP